MPFEIHRTRREFELFNVFFFSREIEFMAYPCCSVSLCSTRPTRIRSWFGMRRPAPKCDRSLTGERTSCTRRSRPILITNGILYGAFEIQRLRLGDLLNCFRVRCPTTAVPMRTLWRASWLSAECSCDCTWRIRRGQCGIHDSLQRSWLKSESSSSTC